MIGKMFRYGVVGIIGTGIHFGTLILLVEIFSLDPVISSTIGFILTLIVSYILNYFWTFASSQAHSRAIFRYAVVSISGLLLNAIIMYITVNILDWHYVLGQTVVIFVIPITNFALNNWWSFRESYNS